MHDIHMQLWHSFTDWLMLLTPLIVWLHWPYVAIVWWNTRRSWMQQHRRRVFLLFTLLEKRSGWGIFLSRFSSQSKHMPIVSCKSVQKYERTLDVMSKKATENLSWVDRSNSDTATKDLRNSDQDPQCHHGRSSQGKIDALNLETKVGH